MLKRLLLLLALVIVVGCGSKSDPAPKASDSGSTTTAAVPTTERAKAMVVDHLAQCGWTNVEMVKINALDKAPVKVEDDHWAYQFTATYTNILGEKQTCTDWTAIIIREKGELSLSSCLNDKLVKVGGHTGTEPAEKASNIMGNEAPMILLPD